MTTETAPHYLEAPAFAWSSGERIAYHMSAGQGPTIIWCGGLKSDMDGGKATHLHSWAEESGRAFIRFDYFGHGKSSGQFRDGTISRWARDVVQVMDDLCDGDVILVGSSMGGWSSLLAALERPARVKGLLLIAPAPDFTEKLMWAGFTDEQRRTIEDEGLLLVPSDYDEPYEYSRALIYDGRENLLLDSPIEFAGPVRILQGMQDASVPWEYAQKLLGVITSDDMEMTLVKSGDHSLSTPHDLERLTRTLEELCTRV